MIINGLPDWTNNKYMTIRKLFRENSCSILQTPFYIFLAIWMLFHIFSCVLP